MLSADGARCTVEDSFQGVPRPGPAPPLWDREVVEFCRVEADSTYIVGTVAVAFGTMIRIRERSNPVL